MKINKRKLFLEIIVLFILLLTSSCTSQTPEKASELSSEQKATLQAKYDILVLKAKTTLNNNMLFLVNVYKDYKTFKYKETSFYSHKNAKLYSDPSLNQNSAERLDHKSEVIVDLPKKFDKKEVKDDNLVYKTISVNGKKIEKFVRAKDLFSERYDFIEMPEDGISYEAFPKKTYKTNPPIKMRGVYVSQSSAANGGGNLDYLIKLARTTDINAFIIDVKDDSGNLLFKTRAADKYMARQNKHVAINDIKSFVKKLRDEDIYLVARIVTFKSPEYAKAYPNKAIVYKESDKFYKSGDGLIWSSPYDKDLWDYNISIAEEAAEIGFNEIQFDYVRFPDVPLKVNCQLNFKNDNNESKTVAINKFLKEAHNRLSRKEVYITADFFGFVATAINDQYIGQHWESVVNVVDYAAPMIYPSHYGKYNFGLAVPDAHPYECVDGAIKDAISRNKNLYTPAKLRPWIQDFTAGWVRGHIQYGKQEVEAQIKSLKDNGIDEYMLWNAGNRYTADGLHND